MGWVLGSVALKVAVESGLDSSKLNQGGSSPAELAYVGVPLPATEENGGLLDDGPQVAPDFVAAMRRSKTFS